MRSACPFRRSAKSIFGERKCPRESLFPNAIRVIKRARKAEADTQPLGRRTGCLRRHRELNRGFLTCRHGGETGLEWNPNENQAKQGVYAD